MLRVVLFALALLGGCGRRAFDQVDHDAQEDPDAQVDPDTQEPTGICGAKASAPDPIVLTGYSYYYVDFLGTRERIGNTTVRVVDRATDAELAMGTSDANGDYSLSIPTGGRAADVELVFERAAWFTTREIPDRPLDGDQTAEDVALWALGAGPLWALGAIDSVYAAGGATRNPALGMINIAVRDCVGNAVEGAMVQIEPAPEYIRYERPNGSYGGNVSQLPTGTAVAMNVPLGMVTITATLPGRTFAPQIVNVTGGDNVTIVIARALD